MYDMNKGYNGYSMSKRAIEAYESGEKPLSKWKKADIINGIKAIDPDKAAACGKVKAEVLKKQFLRPSSWHHTSSRLNRTRFYAVDEFMVRHTSMSKIDELAKIKENTPPAEQNKYIGDIRYLEWEGTRKHPKPIRCEKKNVLIEEKGSFYVVYDLNGQYMMKKKMNSNGTFAYKKSPVVQE